MEIVALRLLSIVTVSSLAGVVWIEGGFADRDGKVPLGDQWVYRAAADLPPWNVPTTQPVDEGDVDVEEPWRPLFESSGIDAATLRMLADAGALIIDTRSAANFDQAHLDARNIIQLGPEDVGFSPSATEVSNLIMLGVPIVLYCTSTPENCAEAIDTYAAFEATLGDMPTVYIFGPGWDGIEAAGLPIRTTVDERAVMDILADVQTAFMSGELMLEVTTGVMPENAISTAEAP